MKIKLRLNILNQIKKKGNDTCIIPPELEYDERFIRLREFLQEYADLATRGKDYPNAKVDKLFESCRELADKAVIALAGRYKYFTELEYKSTSPYSQEEIMRYSKYYTDSLKIKEKIRSAITRTDKVLAIDAFVHLMHENGFLLPELFDFPLLYEPMICYTKEILDELAR